jgi:hypothetical protein
MGFKGNLGFLYLKEGSKGNLGFLCMGFKGNDEFPLFEGRIKRKPGFPLFLLITLLKNI